MRIEYVTIFFLALLMIPMGAAFPLEVTSTCDQNVKANQDFQIYVTLKANEQMDYVKCKINAPYDFKLYKSEKSLGTLLPGKTKTCSFTAKAPNHATEGQFKIDTFYSKPWGGTSSVVTNYLDVSVKKSKTYIISFKLTSGSPITAGVVTVEDLSGKVIEGGSASAQCSTCPPIIRVELPKGSYKVYASGYAENGRSGHSGAKKINVARDDTIPLMLYFI